jgi:hypothetical protein
MLLRVLLLGTLSASAVANPGPADAVREFYTWRMASATAGAPDRDDLARMQPMLTPELACVLDAARRYRDGLIAQMTPENQFKPPFAEGDFYSGLFMTPRRFAVGESKIEGSRARVEIRFLANEMSGDMWTDARVKLRRTADRWRIDDVDFREIFTWEGFDFATAGTLMKNLYLILEHDAAAKKASDVAQCHRLG